MLYSKKNREELESLKKLISLYNQLKAVRLQGKLGKENFHEDMKKVFEAITDILKDIFYDITEKITKTSNKNNIALDNINDKVLESMNEKSIIATNLNSSLVFLFEPENTSQPKLMKDHSSNEMNVFFCKWSYTSYSI